jgi:hypothetical protein
MDLLLALDKVKALEERAKREYEGRKFRYPVDWKAGEPVERVIRVTGISLTDDLIWFSFMKDSTKVHAYRKIREFHKHVKPYKEDK